MQSPALTILKQVDELLFCHLPNMERLAVAYKSFKLLKVRSLIPSLNRPELQVDFWKLPVLPQRDKRRAGQGARMATTQHLPIKYQAPRSR